MGNRVLYSLARRMYMTGERMLLAMFQALPDRIGLRLAERLEFIREVDYTKRRIRLVMSSIAERVRIETVAAEPDTVAWIEGFAPGDVMYDVGANVGVFTLIAAVRGHRVVAFEPGATNFAHLCRNLLENDVGDLVTPVPLALAEKTRLSRFHYSRFAPGAALHALGMPVDHRGTIFRPSWSQWMLAHRLDQLVKDFELPKPNHIKIDVDGIEADVLVGAGQLLDGVTSALIEAGKDRERIVNLMQEHGLFEVAHNRVGGDGMYNLIFARRISP